MTMNDTHPLVVTHEDPVARERIIATLKQAGFEIAAPGTRSNGHAVASVANGHDLLETAVRDEMTLRELSDLYTARILDRVNGNKVRAARILGINRRTLYRRGEARRRDAALRAAGDNHSRERNL